MNVYALNVIFVSIMIDDLGPSSEPNEVFPIRDQGRPGIQRWYLRTLRQEGTRDLSRVERSVCS